MSRVHRSPTTTGTNPRGGDPTDSEAIVRVLFEKSPLLVYIVDLDFKVVLINRTLRESTGYDTSDCPNVDALLRRFYPDNEYRSVVEGIHQGFVRNEHIRDTELVATIKDSTQRTISWSTSRLRIGRGPSVGYICFGIDVTTRRNLQQWVTLFQRSLAHLHEGVIMTEPSGRVLAWSDGAAELLGYKDDEMQGRPLSDLYLSAEREIIARTVDRSIDGEGRYSGEVELEHKSGSTRILAFEQHRLDGDQGVPLARLTVLAEPGGSTKEQSAALAERVAQFEAQIAERDSALAALQAEQRNQVSSASDAEGQLAALRAELQAASAQAQALQGAVHAAQNAAADAAKQTEQAAARVIELESLVTAHDTQSSERLAAVQGEVSETAKARDVALASAEAARKQAEAFHEEADAARLAAEAAKMAAEMEADDLRDQLEEAQGSATAKGEALDAAEARAAEASAAIKALEEKAGEAAGLAEAADARIAELEATLVDVQTRADEAEAASLALSEATENAAKLEATIAELQAGADKAGEGIAAELKEARERIAELQGEAEAAQERWIQERSKLEDDHRAIIDSTQDKAARERQSLEEQLSRDILAAEERSESERSKLVKQHELERKGLEDAIEIARAEVESEYTARVEGLRAELSRAGALQPHLVPLTSSAVVAADTEGRIIGWSGGAGLLDRRPGSDAIGKSIHKDVLALEGINWKKLFGKVVIAGRLEQDVTLVDAQGNRRDVLLKAALIKDEGGKLLGVTEVLVAPELLGGVDLHARAAFGRLAEPVHGAIEARALAGLESHRKASAAATDLARLGEAVLEGGTWADVNDVARRIGLRELLPVVDEVLRSADDSWRDLRATAQDLGHLAGLMDSDEAHAVPWTELVARCLHAVLSSGGLSVKRELGDGGSITARTDRLVALLVVLMETLRGTEGATVRSGLAEGAASLDLLGVSADRSTLAVARALARDLGGTIEADEQGLHLSLPSAPPRIDIPGVMEDRDGEATELISADVVSQLSARGDDVSAIVEVVGGEAELEVEAFAEDDEAIEAGEAPEDEPIEAAEDDTAEAEEEEALELDEDEDEDEDAKPAEKAAKGSVEFVEEGEFGNMLLAAGEVSIIASVPGSPIPSPVVPGIDALEEVFQDGADVSPALLAQAAEMDAYAEARGQAPDTDAPKPSAELLAEMTSTDTGERLGQAAAKVNAQAKKKAPAKRRRSRKPRKKN